MNHTFRANIFRGSTAFGAGFFLLSVVLAAYVLSALVLFCGLRIASWQFPLAVLLAGCATVALSLDMRVLRGIAISVVISVLAGAVCTLFEDSSFDGNVYHQKIMALMLEGWNPYHDTGTWSHFYDPYTWHYAKAIEMAGASVTAFTGYIESGKVINFMLLFAGAFLMYDFMQRTGGIKSVGTRVGLVLLMACNPVCISQMLTYYNDYVKYICLVLTLIAAASIDIARTRAERKIWLSVLCGAIILAVGTKFNAFFEEGLAIALFLIWLACKKRWRLAFMVICVSAAVTLFALFVLGYHPYITNLLSHGHPLYPLMGEGAIDIMSYNTPFVIEDLDRFSAFVVSLFTPEIPNHSQRLGGFTFLMPLMLVCVAIIMIELWRGRKSNFRVYSYICICVLASCFVFEQSWWARYICQLWIVPVVAAYAVRSDTSVTLVWLRRVLIICGIVAALITAVKAIRISYPLSVKRQVLYSVCSCGVVYMANMTLEAKHHFTERGIKVNAVAIHELGKHAVRFFGEDDSWPHPIIGIDSVQIIDFNNIGKRWGINPERHLFIHGGNKL